MSARATSPARAARRARNAPHPASVRALLAGVAVCAVAGAFLVGALPLSALGPAVLCTVVLGGAHTALPGGTGAFCGKLLLVAAGVGAALTLVDLGLRPFVHMSVPVVWEDGRTGDGFHVDEGRVGDLARMLGDDDRAEPRSVAVYWDAHGFRNRPEATRPQRPYDVIVLGDSFGHGDGTSQDDIFPERLRSDFGLEVYNLSKSGGDPWDEFLTLEEEIGRLRTRPGTVVLWTLFPANDLGELEHRYGPIARDEDEVLWGIGLRLRRFRDRSPLRRLLLDLWSFIAPAPALASSEVPGSGTPPTTAPEWPGSSAQVIAAALPGGASLLFYRAYVEQRSCGVDGCATPAALEKLRNIAGLLADLARDRGLVVKVVAIPSKPEVYGWVVDRTSPWSSVDGPTLGAPAVEVIARDAGMEFLDLKPAIVRAARERFERSGDLLWWTDDSHLNAHGHAVVARVVSERLLRGVASP